MPIYEYYCGTCTETTEHPQTAPDGGPPTKKCEICGDTAYRVLSRVFHSGKDKGKA